MGGSRSKNRVVAACEKETRKIGILAKRDAFGSREYRALRKESRAYETAVVGLNKLEDDTLGSESDAGRWKLRCLGREFLMKGVGTDTRPKGRFSREKTETGTRERVKDLTLD